MNLEIQKNLSAVPSRYHQEPALRALGCRRYRFHSEVPDSAHPQFEVTGLQLD
ncbi:MAG: hypothetical protein NT154_05115 [Verrucomicrobia bacterium]|nr:hypothetical protein [Verrucomicrobiota bacterium]